MISGMHFNQAMSTNYLAVHLIGVMIKWKEGWPSVINFKYITCIPELYVLAYSYILVEFVSYMNTYRYTDWEITLITPFKDHTNGQGKGKIIHIDKKYKEARHYGNYAYNNI